MPKGLLMIAGPEKDEAKEPEKSTSKSPSLSAAKALLSAIKADDAAKADEALKLHYEICSGESDEDSY